MSEMAPNYQLISTVGVENMTHLATRPITLPPAIGDGPSPGPGQYPPRSPAPAPPYTEHDPEVVGHGSMTPPPSYAESNPGLIISDAKAPPCASNSLLLSLQHGPDPEKQNNGGAICTEALDEPRSLLRLCHPYGGNDSVGPNTTSCVPELRPICCATTSKLGSKDLNYHVNSNNDVYRWQMTDTPIPVSIDISSFETKEQGYMARRCLVTVLHKFYTNNVGPKFCFVHDPSDSAFFVRFGGDYPIYAQAFFPGSFPKDWYIDIFKPGLTLSEEQEQFLIRSRPEDISAARTKALEENLIKILTHEMLHVVGVRHCDAQVTERRERCVRFPPNLSDEENYEERLMQRELDWRTFSELDWMDRTIREIQEIYAMKNGDYIGGHKIRDVVWRVGADQRKEIARRNARCCIA